MIIGFAGLGQMGKPMAMNLLKGGDQLVVTSLRSDSFPEFEKRGVQTTSNPADLARAEVIFLCLPNGEVVKNLLLGEKGLLQHLKAGQIVVDTSTIAYSATLEIARELETCGVAFLDAPVSGMEARAVDGTLTIMCGGEPKTFEVVKPLFERMGNKIFYMGAAGSGQLTKLVNQLLFDINAAALAEILPLSVKLKLDPDQVCEVINSGTGKSYASSFFLPRILKGNFSDGYPMQSAYKDLVSGAEISANLCIPTPILAAATAVYQMALLQGYGKHDKGGMIQVFENLLEVKYRSQTD